MALTGSGIDTKLLALFGLVVSQVDHEIKAIFT